MQRERLLRLKEVSSIVGLSRSTIYDLSAKGLFPERVLLGKRAVGWWESEIEAWIATRPRVGEGSAKSNLKNREG